MNAIRTSHEMSATGTSTPKEHFGDGRQQASHTAASDQTLGAVIQSLGAHVLRYGLALVIGWIGLMKFTAYEAAGIQPLVANSPLMGWMYGFLSVRQFSAGLGVVEVA
ncbi:MAG TPA: DUF417 family protein, partial [Bryobacteraceae bacterium]|nr:DUF417 family protein [Bryobacteraceae bacterium]